MVRPPGMARPDQDRVLFVDGPPATTGPQARYPAMPLLSGSLSPVATAVLDDLVVPDMQEVLRRWLDAYPEFACEILPLEKSTTSTGWRLMRECVVRDIRTHELQRRAQ